MISFAVSYNQGSQQRKRNIKSIPLGADVWTYVRLRLAFPFFPLLPFTHSESSGCASENVMGCHVTTIRLDGEVISTEVSSLGGGTMLTLASFVIVLELVQGIVFVRIVVVAKHVECEFLC
jgi:hypothetical protein